MVDEEKVEGEKGNIYKSTGKKWGFLGLGKVVDIKLPEIPGESVGQSWLRQQINRWEKWGMTWKVLTIGFVALAIAIFHIYLVSGLVIPAIIISLVIAAVGAEIIANYHMKGHWYYALVTKLKDNVKITNIKSEGTNLTFDVLETKLAPGEDPLQEYRIIDKAVDPKNPDGIRLIDCTIIQTGFRKWILAKDFDIEHRILIGEAGDYPGLALLPLVYDLESQIPKAEQWISKLFRKGKLTPEEVSALEEEGNRVVNGYNDYVKKLEAAGVKKLNKDNAGKNGMQLVVGLDSIGSQIFTSYKEYQDHNQITLSVRRSRVMNMVNMDKEVKDVLSWFLENKEKITLEAYINALQTIMDLEGTTDEAIRGGWAALKTKMDELKTIGVKRQVEEATGEEIHA